MERIPSLKELRECVALGENQRQEFKVSPRVPDRVFKNKLMVELVALANGGGGRLFVGVEDEPPHEIVGLDVVDAEALAKPDHIASLMEGRVAPVPDLDVYTVSIDRFRAVVVFSVEAPWKSANAQHMPVIFTQEIQDEGSRVVVSIGTLMIRDGTRCQRVASSRQLERVMRPLMQQYEADRMVPLLRELGRRDLLDEAKVTAYADAFAAELPFIEDELAALQRVCPAAVMHVCRMVLEGVELNRKQQHELVDTSSAPRRGWPVPPYIRHLVEPGLNGTLAFRHFDRPDAPVRGDMSGFQEFWYLSPGGAFVTALLDQVDMMASIDRVPQKPPGPERAVDPMGLSEQVLGFVMFARNAAWESGAERVWISISFENVLERPIGRTLHPEAPIRNRILNYGDVSNRSRIEVSGAFASAALAAEWRGVAADWNLRVLKAFGLHVAREDIDQLHERLLALYEPPSRRRR